MYLSLRVTDEYLKWDVEDTAMKAGFQLAAAYRLELGDFPGYQHTMVDTGKISHFNVEPARSQLCTFAFRRREGIPPLRPFQSLQ